MTSISVTLPITTRNPLNGAQGGGMRAVMAKSRQRKAQRQGTAFALRLKAASCRIWLGLDGAVEITLTRFSPGELDQHDGLRAALKSCVDGVTDALGLKSDRDSRLVFIYAQKRAPQHAVQIDLRHIAHQPPAFAVKNFKPKATT